MAARTTAARRGGARAPAAAAARAPASARAAGRGVVARAAEEGGAQPKGLGEKLTGVCDSHHLAPPGPEPPALPP